MMKKSIIALSVLIATVSSVSAATYHAPDQSFIETIAQVGITSENWDSGESAKLMMKNAYRMTSYMEISNEGTPVQDFGKASGLDLRNLNAYDFDGEHNLEVIARDRLNIESMVITKDSKLIDAYYWNGSNVDSTHLQMSVSKSITSIVLSMLVAEDKVDMNAKVTHYLPELIGSGFEYATVQEVADMRSGIKINFSEGKLWDDRMSNVQEWNGVNKYPELKGVLDFATLVESDKSTKVGKYYNYQCINTEILAKVAEAVTGQQFSELIETKLWAKVGLKHPAKWMSNAQGELVASGGLNATTEDMARLMGLFVNQGKNHNGEQVIPTQFINAILAGNSEVDEAWLNGKESKMAKDAWYKDQVRVFNIKGHQFFAFVGIHGQVTIGEPSTKTVIAMNAAQDQRQAARTVLITFFDLVPTLLDAVNK